MRACSYLGFVGVCLLLVSCVDRPAANTGPRAVTISQLLLAPGAFDGAPVLVKGFFLQPMVGDIALYQTEPDYHRGSPESHVRLDLDPKRRDLRPFQLKRCAVEGTFQAGHGPSAWGRITNITRLELAE